MAIQPQSLFLVLLALPLSTLLWIHLRTHTDAWAHNPSLLASHSQQLFDFVAYTKADLDAAFASYQRAVPVQGSMGIVLTGSAKSASLAVMAAELIRATGCTLPIEYAYLGDELTNQTMSLLRASNITPRNFLSPAIKSSNWDIGLLKLGAAKVSAILSSPFEKVLFLDPDVMLLRDPTYLFSTPQFKRTGALFWPDFSVTPRDRAIWQITKQPYSVEFEFESGQIVLDKSNKHVYLGLLVAEYLCRHGAFYFKHFWGDKDAFRWGFRVAGVPYFLNTQQVHGNVSLIPPSSIPSNSAQIIQSGAPLASYIGTSASGRVPAKGTHCGQNMLQLDFDTNETQDPSTAYEAKPLFMHANGIKWSWNYDDSIPPFQSAQMYALPKGETLTSWAQKYGAMASYKYIGQLNGRDCGTLVPVNGIELSYLSINERYMAARENAFQESATATSISA
ncbi:mannosyltransferase putative-domain-containing protein [Chytriomyces cf. hyalinus JEL632]|nr:mannosyltransferase putative-domain-containing protein [Chytriomyces cf. hyalinus JEL632]